jgi:hypothetical protein
VLEVFSFATEVCSEQRMLSTLGFIPKHSTGCGTPVNSQASVEVFIAFPTYLRWETPIWSQWP